MKKKEENATQLRDINGRLLKIGSRVRVFGKDGRWKIIHINEQFVGAELMTSGMKKRRLVTEAGRVRIDTRRTDEKFGKIMDDCADPDGNRLSRGDKVYVTDSEGIELFDMKSITKACMEIKDVIGKGSVSDSVRVVIEGNEVPVSNVTKVTKPRQ